MRNEARNQKNVTMVNVQGYHSSRNQDGARASSPRTLTSPHGATVDYSESYAFEGFRGNWYLNSDRKIALDDHFQRADGQPLQGYGLEIETVCDGISNPSVLAETFDKIIFPQFKFGDVQFKMQRDSSLTGHASSVECITQVMTKSRIRNDYAAYKAMFDTYFPAFQISADSHRTPCGMHVNVSNALFGKTVQAQVEAVRKLYYIVNRHYNFCCALFYRDARRTRYCSQMSYSDARRLRVIGNTNGSHGNSMNLSHFDAGRVEIRLVGGQKDYYTFRNTMEAVFFLVERVRSISWRDCDDIEAIFKGCNQYVIKRLEDCALSVETFRAIEAACKPEDLELRRG